LTATVGRCSVGFMRCAHGSRNSPTISAGVDLAKLAVLCALHHKGSGMLPICSRAESATARATPCPRISLQRLSCTVRYVLLTQQLSGRAQTANTEHIRPIGDAGANSAAGHLPVTTGKAQYCPPVMPRMAPPVAAKYTVCAIHCVHSEVERQ
jgi:hypothetical protein